LQLTLHPGDVTVLRGRLEEMVAVNLASAADICRMSAGQAVLDEDEMYCLELLVKNAAAAATVLRALTTHPFDRDPSAQSSTAAEPGPARVPAGDGASS
jgi:hypothetical protein